jgi:uncharacterized Tic20 family protein
MAESRESSSPTESSSEDRTWALVAHAGAPVGLLLSAGMLGFVVPLVVWLAKRERSAFVADQAREALNFHITLFVIHAVCWFFVLATLGIGLLVAVPFFLVLWVAELVLGISGALAAYEGRWYRYPFAMRLISGS